MTAFGEAFDLVILGGGPGGYVAALRGAQLGAHVALIEKRRIGGACLNVGCIPTKALLASAESYRDTRAKSAVLGVDISSAVINWMQMQQHKQDTVDQLVRGIEQLLNAKKVTLVHGEGYLLSPRRVQIDTANETHEIDAPRIIIGTGAVPATLPVPGTNLAGAITSTEALSIERVPERLVIIGAGVIGIEFASLYRALGAQVTVLEMLPRILVGVDEELARRLLQFMRRDGIDFQLNAQVLAIEEGEPLTVRYANAEGEHTAPGDTVLVATGRIPLTRGVGLESLGIAMNGHAITVNERMQTNVEGVYAIGDVVGGWMLAHVASAEGKVAAENALGRTRAIDYRAVPNCVYSMPELATVGMTEVDARAAQIPIKVGKFPFSANARALSFREMSGLVKIIAHAETGVILGMHILGPRATDLIAEGALAVQAGLTAYDIGHLIHAHPTLPEAVMEAALDVTGEMIHFQRVTAGA
jgi:dihydrolipoamide dehydrogenase